MAGRNADSNRLRPFGIRGILVIALVLALIVTVLSLPSVAPAQETLTLRGRVVNGTASAETPGSLQVLLLVTGPDGTLSETGQAQAGPDGTFELEDVALVEGALYNVSVDFGGVFYGENLLPSRLSEELVITVFEPTEDASLMRVDRQVMVISDIDVAQRRVTATEFVRFTNPTDRTLRPNVETARPGMFSFMRFALPPDAADITVQSDLRGGDVLSVGTGFAITAAVTPGEHSVDFAYTFPYEDGSLEFRNSLPQGAGIFQILVPQRYDGVEIGGVAPRPPVGIGDEVYRAWEGRDIPAGPGVQLKFDGLPQPGVLVRAGNTLSGGGFWVAAIPVAMGAVLLAFLLLGLFRRRRPATAGAAAGTAGVDGVGDTQRAELVAALAALDDRYHDGGMDEDDYLRRRAALVDRALGREREDSE